MKPTPPDARKSSEWRGRMFFFLASDFSCADCLKSAFSPWRRSARLLTRVVIALVFDCLQHLSEVVARRILQRREFLVGFELLQPQELSDGQNVPVVDVRGTRRGQDAAGGEEGLLLFAHV